MPGEPWRQFECYTVLSISSGATPEEIRTAYRKISQKTHPDSGGSHEAQVRVNLAYEVLSDPISRQAHDFYWHKSSIHAQRAEKPISSTAQARRPSSPSPKPKEGEPKAGSTSSNTAGLGSSLESLFKRVEKSIDLEVEKFKAKHPENVRNKFTQYQQQFENAKRSRLWRFGIFFCLTLLALSANNKFAALAWVAAIVAGIACIPVVHGTRISSQFVSFNDSSWQQRIQAIANEELDAEIARLQAGLQEYKGKVGSLGEIVSRFSSFDESEEQIARRITIALFLMGYIPEQNDRQSRILVFTSGEERILVRFRHRSGMALNISYVERMVAAMQIYRCTRGFLFCTPGLSANGELFARKQNITWYSLETMNKWVTSVLDSNYAGPHGEILSLLDKLMIFLGQISTPLSYRGRGWRRRRYT